MDAPRFDPPGPGHWALDRSHYPGGATPISQWLIEKSSPAGLERVFAELGAPLRTVSSRFVNGFMYTRIVPLVGADKPSTKLPPTFVLKLATRLHPEFRRRAAQAEITISSMPSIDVAARWEHDMKPEIVAANAALQAIDLATLDDTALEAHIGEVLDHALANFELHFWLHGHDLGPIAQLLHACEGWDIEGDEAVQMLAGASPSTTEPLRVLCRLRAILEAADRPVHDLDELRAVSDDAARLLDDYLARRGGVLATGYDLTNATLAELPGLVFESIRTAQLPDPPDGDAAEGLRERVPPDERARFDEYLHQARTVMDMRDDNGPLTAEWPAGLIRRALLEAGRRATERGTMHEAAHALELTPDEARRALTAERPDADELAARRTGRIELSRVDPPITLGPPEAEPPLDILPGKLPLLVAMVQTVFKHMGMEGDRHGDGYSGVGVGSRPYTGRVCRVADADEALERLEPGDVLVVRATSPAFNVVLAIAGAVVTADGGAMSHAAVLARELGIPAVVGAHAALDLPDQATVTVDPAAGRVELTV